MKKMEEEDAREQSDLRARIQQLETQLDAYSQLLLSYRPRMQELESNLEEEKRLRETAEAELLTTRNNERQMTDAVPLPRRSVRQKQQSTAKSPFNEAQPLPSFQNVPLGCGNCSQDTRCECIEQAFDINDITANTSDALGKRPHSPPSEEDNKRFRPDAAPESQDNEIDFTARFSSSRKAPNIVTATSTISNPLPANPDPCGFCKDGSPCICAEMALESMKAESRQVPRENDTITSSAPSNPCINGPGTCDRCLVDANSTLFCKSLAATRPGYRTNQPPTASALKENVPDNNDDLPPTPSSSVLDFPDPEANENQNRDAQTSNGVTLSCADAYETLSRHPAFEKASEELSTWMPQLATVPGGRERTAFEVEAASVMSVLRFFNHRFGTSAEKA